QVRNVSLMEHPEDVPEGVSRIILRMILLCLDSYLEIVNEMSYFIDGVIQSGSLVSLIDEKYNLLIYENGVYSYVNVNTGTISPYYAVLQLVIDSYDANSLYVYFKNADTYVYLVGGTVATSTTPPNRMTLTQTTFQPWG